jgi:hypothetical protein
LVFFDNIQGWEVPVSSKFLDGIKVLFKALSIEIMLSTIPMRPNSVRNSLSCYLEEHFAIPFC